MALHVSFDCESCENENCTGKWLKSTVYKCGGYKHKQTNADRIRAMTDEELAEFHERQTVSESCWECPANDVCMANNDSPLETLCKDSYLIWLKQEASE